MFISTKPICEFIVSLPAANRSSRRSGGICSERTTLIWLNSGLVSSLEHRKGANSAPSMVWLFRRPPSCARNCSVQSGRTP